MGLSFHCPQCSQTVPALPTQMGQQVTCPGCQAQFRLSPLLLGGNGHSHPAAKAVPPAATAGALPVAPPVASVVKAPPRSPAAQPRAARMPTAPVAPPVVARTPASSPAPASPAPPTAPNVARFIAAASQDSTVQLTADGKLPELSLAEATAKKTKTTESNTSPLVLGLVLSVSTLASILLLFAEFEGNASDATSVKQAREDIAKYYVSHSGSLLPYQVLLREAQRAAGRGDYGAEREAYRRVRDLLLSESKDPYAGVTGTQSGDDELARLLGVLLDAEGR